MPDYAWSCLVCEESNAASNLVCLACSCPAHVSNKEIQSRRAAATQETTSVTLVVSKKYSKSRWLLILCLINSVLAFGIMALGIAGGGNTIGASMVAGLALIPTPFFLIAAGFFFVMEHNAYKGRKVRV